MKKTIVTTAIAALALAGWVQASPSMGAGKGAGARTQAEVRQQECEPCDAGERRRAEYREREGYEREGRDHERCEYRDPERSRYGDGDGEGRRERRDWRDSD